MGYKFNPFTGNFDIDNVSAVTGGASSDGVNRISAGTQIAGTNATVVFSNSNNVSFGMSNNSIVTASASFNQSVQTQGMVSINGGTGDISFSNSNGITFGRNASTVTASHNGLTSQSNQAFSAAGGSSAFQTLSFADGNGVSFTNTNGSIGATVKTDYLTTARASTDAIGLNTAKTNVTWTVNSSGLSLDAGGYAGTGTTFNGANISASLTQNSAGLQISASVNPGGAGSSWTVSDNATSATVGRLAFTNANGLTMTLSTSNNGNHTVIGSYTVPSTAGLISAINVSGGTTSNNLSKLTFNDSNGVSFGLNGSVLTATVKTDYQSSNNNYLTSQSNQALSGSNGSFTFQTATFGNLNGMSFYTSNNSMVGSYTVPTVTNSSLTVQAGASTLSSVSRMAFGDGNGVSFGASTSNNGSVTITASHNGLTSQSNQAVSNSAGSFTFQTLNFSNANNVTFGTSAGGIVTASVAAPGAAAENNWFNLTGNTAGNTSASGSTIMLSATGDVTISGTNGSQIVISGGGGGGGATGSYFDNMFQQNSVQALTFTSVSTGLFNRAVIQPLAPGNELFPYDMTASTMLLNFSANATATIASSSHSSTFLMGIYTRSDSTKLNLLNSVQATWGMTANTGNSGSYNGARYLSVHSSQWSSQPVFKAGSRYFFAFIFISSNYSGSSGSSLANSMAGMHLGASVQRSGWMGSAASSNTSYNAWHPFMGVHSVVTHTSLPATIANTEINKASAYANFIPQVILNGGLGAMG